MRRRKKSNNTKHTAWQKQNKTWQHRMLSMEWNGILNIYTVIFYSTLHAPWLHVKQTQMTICGEKKATHRTCSQYSAYKPWEQFIFWILFLCFASLYSLVVLRLCTRWPCPSLFGYNDCVRCLNGKTFISVSNWLLAQSFNRLNVLIVSVCCDNPLHPREAKLVRARYKCKQRMFYVYINSNTVVFVWA